MTQGTHPWESVVRGDTFDSQEFLVVIDSIPAAIDSAIFSIREKGSLKLVYSSACSVLSNTVTTPSATAEITALWAIGTHIYDIQFIIAGKTKTYIKGEITVTQDVTY